jgi:putative RNA 2'-phosphotransferase
MVIRTNVKNRVAVFFDAEILTKINHCHIYNYRLSTGIDPSESWKKPHSNVRRYRKKLTKPFYKVKQRFKHPMGKNRTPEQLAKLTAYILERHPEEFGLILNPDGFVSIKELLKVVHEESGYGYVRRSHLNEIQISIPASLEIRDDRIRAINRENLASPSPADHPPKILFTCIRRKAHAVVIDKGIYPQGADHVVLSSDRNMAERIGRRKDSQPIVLEVHTVKSYQQGVRFYQSGDSLFLADFIPPDCFSAPPLPKEKHENEKPAKVSRRNKPEREEDFTPGTFYMDISPEKKSKKTGAKPKSRKAPWKKDRKKLRKEKENMGPE